MRACLVIGILVGLLATPAPAQAEGALVIHGGGRVSSELQKRFVALGGGTKGRLVVIPTASDNPTATEKLVAGWASWGFSSVEVLHARSRDEANDVDFAAALTTATAVWFAGGEQARLERIYRGTPVETELHALLGRGGVIGGSSAGAAIMSQVMIRGGKTRPRMGSGLDLLPGAIIDQHFVARAREHRLLAALRKHRTLVGYGIDEGTAMIVKDSQLEVIGDSTVTVAMAAVRGEPAKLIVLADGETADLEALTDEAIERSAP
jgi:cyanophycinase